MATRDVTFAVKGLADLDVNSLITSANRAQQALTQLKLPNTLEASFTSLFAKISSQIADFQSKSSGTFRNMADVKAAEKSFITLDKLVESLQTDLKKIDTSKLSLKDTRIAQEIANISDQLAAFNAQVKGTSKSIETTKKTMSTALSAKIDTDDLVKAAAEGGNLTEVFRKLRSYNTLSFKVTDDQVEQAEKNVKDLTVALEEARQKRGQLQTKAGGGGEGSDALKNARLRVAELVLELDKAKTKQDELNTKMAQFKTNQAALTAIKDDLVEVANSAKAIDLEHTQEALNNLESERVAKVSENLKTASDNSEELAGAMKGQVAPALQAIGKSADQIERANAQMNSLKQNMVQFFSIATGWRMLKNVIQSAFETVKDLDAEMTEIAVVTSMSLDQVWAKRGEYSKNAAEMGSSTLDMVAASKLYYQQGLSQSEVTQAATETIKMARIANLDGAKATDLMTAAVRGFNMEMSEAGRVNDVYSQLAAKTASDTLEIAEAMTRTASIANAAGASFENTAAFLTQMIETTREAPENLGTALKTIIARFQEMKKAPGDIGEVDGEIVDANKIETALRTVNIALRNSEGEFRNFDDVIMDISAKWDDMDMMTQRYIATTAAGSRQQSRFIALVQNNARLLQLTGYAADSAGASQEQFNKTLDSLQSKLNQMGVALDLFWTNFLNSDVIKGAIDLFTGFLTTINKIMAVLPGFGKTLFGIVAAFAAFKGGNKLIDAAFSKVGNTMVKSMAKSGGKAGQLFSEAFATSIKPEGFKTRFDSFLASLQSSMATIFSKAGWISDPINDAVKNTQTLELAMKGLGAVDLTTATSQLSHLYDTSQIDAYVSARQNGMEIDKASLLLTNQEIASKYSEIMANDALTASEKQQQVAELLTNSTAQMGILTRAKYTAQLLFGKAATRAAAAEALGLKVTEVAVAGATDGATTAQWSLNAALTACPIGWIVAGLAAVVGAFILFDKVTVTNAERIQAFTEDIAKFKSETEDAKSDLDSLTDATNKLAEAKTAFEGLTKGTNEWKSAIVDTNLKILELINNYPQLAAALETKDGVLTINEGVLETTTKTAQARVVVNEMASLALEMSKMKFEKVESSTATRGRTRYYEDVSYGRNKRQIDPSTNLPYTGPEFTSLNAVSNQQYQDIAKEFVAAGYSVSQLAQNSSDASKKLAELYTSITGRDPIGEMFASFREEVQSSNIGDTLGETAGENFTKVGIDALQASTQLEGMSDSLAAMTIASNDYLNNLSADDTMSAVSDAIQGVADRLFDGFQSDIDARIANMDKDVNEAGNEKDAAVERYKTITGLSKKEVDDKYAAGELTDQMLRETVATEEARVEASIKLETSAKFMASLLKNAKPEKRALVNIASEGQKNITKNDMEALYNALDTDSIAKYASSYKDKANQDNLAGFLGIAPGKLSSVLQNLGFGDFSEMIDAMISAESQLDQSMQRLTSVNTEIANTKSYKDLTGQLSLEDLTGFNKLLSNLTMASGAKRAEGLTKTVASNVDLKDPEDIAKVIEQLNMTDLIDVDSIDDFISAMKLIAPSMPTKDLEHFRGLLISVGQATKTFSAEELQKSFNSIGAIIKSIDDGTQKATFSADEYNSMIESGAVSAESFVMDLEGNYVYIGGQMDTLSEALRANTAALLQQQVEKAEALARAGENAAGMHRGDVTVADYEKMTPESMANFINLFRRGEQGVQQADLIGLSSKTEISKETDINILRDFMQKINTLATERGVNAEKASALKGQATTSALLPMSGQQIIDQKFTDPVQIEAQKNALSALVAQEEGLTQVVEDTKAAFKEQGSALANNENLIKAHAIDVRKSQKAIDALNDTIKDNADVLDDAKAAPKDYTKSIAAITKTAKKVFGDKITEDFVKKNIADFKLLDEGGTKAQEAFERIGDAAGKEFAASLEIGANEMKRVEAIASGLDLQIAIGATADFTGVFNELSTLMGSAENAMAYLDSIGYKTTVKQVGTTKVPIGEGEYLTIPINEVAFTRKDSSGTKGGGGTHSGGGGGGGGGGGSSKKWSNTYDWLYNLIEKTNAELRKRNKLEAKYDDMLSDRKQSAKEVYENLKDQEESLKKQAEYYKEQLAGRMKEQGDVEKKYSKYAKYAKYNETTGQVEINWAEINKVKDAKKGQAIEDYIAELERLRDSINDIEDAQQETNDYLEELAKKGRQEYVDLEQRIFDAIVAQRQAEIDNLTEINDSINDSNQALLDGIQNGLSDQRAARDREEALTDLQEKERRLALLKSDASGANALDIMRLEKEIADDRQSYTDSLIDQAIADLQEGNDVAAEQRERQISTMEAQLAEDQKNGVIWDQVNSLLATALAADGNIVDTGLQAFLADWEEADVMSYMGREDWANSLNEQVQAALGWYLGQVELSDPETAARMKGETVTFTDKEGKTHTGTVREDGTIAVSSGSTGGYDIYDDVYMDQAGNWFSTSAPEYEKSEEDLAAEEAARKAAEEAAYKAKYPYGKVSEVGAGLKKGSTGDRVKALQSALNAIGKGNSETKTLNGTFGKGTESALKGFQKSQKISQSGKVDKNTVKKFKAKGYKTGGLADYTGPAWLDGTTANPEIVLDADDSRNFMQLRDVLANLMTGNSTPSGNGGDNYYEIHIEVDELSSDYDVEKLMGKMKGMIAEDAQYRNVQAINFIR